jgi:putative SOS response-associated peptidase YedK
LCNLYSVTKGQQAIRELAGAMRDRTGNLPPLPGIFPDYAAPIVRNQPDGRELTMARWAYRRRCSFSRERSPIRGSPMSAM